MVFYYSNAGLREANLRDPHNAFVHQLDIKEARMKRTPQQAAGAILLALGLFGLTACSRTNESGIYRPNHMGEYDHSGMMSYGHTEGMGYNHSGMAHYDHSHTMRYDHQSPPGS